MPKGTNAFGQGNDNVAHTCHCVVNLETDVTAHGTGSWLARPDFGGVMGKYPSMSGRQISRHLSPWCRVLPTIWRGTLATHRGWLHTLIAPESMTTTKTRIDSNQTVTTQLPEHEGMLVERKGVNVGLPEITNCNRQYCCYLFIVKNCNR